MAGRDSHFGEVDPAALEALLQAPSKEKVNEIFLLAFRARHGATDAQLDKVVEKLGGNSTREEAAALLKAAKQLIMRSVYSSLDAAGTRALLPADFHGALGGLISQIVGHHCEEWREMLLSQQVSEPRLLDTDWRVDIKAASNRLTRMSVPTCFVGLEVQGCQERKGELAPVSHVTFEMNKEELGTMLEGLVKIRDQLSGVAQ